MTPIDPVTPRKSAVGGPTGRSWPAGESLWPFRVGMVGAAGVAVTVGLVELLVRARSVLILIGLAGFLAVGLEPAVAGLVRRGLPRWAAVTTVCGVLVAIVGGFLATAIPSLVTQAHGFTVRAPLYLKALTDHGSLVGRLIARFHLQQMLEQAISSSGGVVSGVFGAGVVVFSALASTGVVLVLTVYFLGSLPRLRTGLYRLVPRSQRPRVIQLGDEIASKVSGYVLGNLLTSLIATILTYVWLLIFNVPYALLLSVLVGLLDLIPTVGSTIAGVIVCLAALTVSLPLALGTAGYFVIYRLLEDYLLSPRIIGRFVQLSPVATVVAVLLGGALLGIIGALVAIPIAAALQLIMREVVLPRLDDH